MLLLLLTVFLTSCCNAGHAGYEQNNFTPQSDLVYTAKPEEFISRSPTYGSQSMFAPQSMRYPPNVFTSNYGNNIMPASNNYYRSRKTKYQPYQKNKNYNSFSMTDMNENPVTDFKPHPVTDFTAHPAVYHPAEQSYSMQDSLYNTNNYDQIFNPTQGYDPYENQDSSYYPNGDYGQNLSGNQNTGYRSNAAYNDNYKTSPNSGYDLNSYSNQNLQYGQNSGYNKNSNYRRNSGYEQNSGYGQESGYGKNSGYDQPIQAVTLGKGAYIPGAGYIEGYPFVYMTDSYNGNLPPGVKDYKVNNSPSSYSNFYSSSKPDNSDNTNSYVSQNNEISNYPELNRFPMRKRLMQNQGYNDGPSQNVQDYNSRSYNY